MKILMSFATVIILCLCAFKAGDLKPDDNIITWDKETKLTWDDFTAKAPSSTTLKALTYSGISMRPHTTDSVMTVNITAIFEKDKSWTKSSTEALLRHEQLHFDITELYARKMRKAYSIKKFTKKTLKTDLTTLYKTQMQLLQAFQSKYDKETNHSRIEAKQAQWEKDIPKAIEALNSQKDSTVVLSVK